MTLPGKTRGGSALFLTGSSSCTECLEEVQVRCLDVKRDLQSGRVWVGLGVVSPWHERQDLCDVC